MTCCFQNLIGIRGCSTEEPPRSGLYINDLEGITLNSAALTANGEQVTGTRLLAEKIAYTTRLLKVELLQRFQQIGQFRFGSVVGSAKGGYQTGVATMPDGLDKGVWLRKCSTGQYSRIYIQCITIYPAETASGVDIVVVDGVLQTTYTVDTVANTPQVVQLNYTAESPDIVIALPHNIVWEQTRLAKATGCLGCTGKSRATIDDTPQLRLYGWTDGKSNSEYSYGLHVEAVLTCNTDAVWCKIPPEQLGLVLLYRTGVELMREAQYSERVNYITVKKQAAEQLEARWLKTYEDQANALINSMQANINATKDECVECSSPRQIWIR